MTEPNLIAETDDYFVINKPAGYSVEPHDHYPSIKDWLEKNYGFEPIMTEANRWGVVHRLDVDTSGVLVWAKTAAAQDELKGMWQGRQVQKTYFGLVAGETQPEGSVELSLERDNQKDLQRVALLPSPKARPAITQYRRLEIGHVRNASEPLASVAGGGVVGEKVSLLECHPITGRTHQIRVHMQYLGHPIIGDKKYGNKQSDKIAKNLNLTRHWLHAASLTLNDQTYTSPLPEDLQSALKLSGLASLEN